MGYLELRIETGLGKIQKGSVRDVPTADNVPGDNELKLVRDANDGVTVHSLVNGAVEQIGRARWSANALVDRYSARGLGDHEWALLTLALHTNPQPKKSRAATGAKPAAAKAEPEKRSRWLNAPLGIAGVMAVAAVAVFLLRQDATPAWISLGGLAIGLAIYSLAGADSQCPKCDVWWHRKRLRREERGTDDSTRVESVKSPVYGTDGKVSGYTYTDRTVDIRIRKYTDFYECTKCQHTWSVDYQSTSRR